MLLSPLCHFSLRPGTLAGFPPPLFPFSPLFSFRRFRLPYIESGKKRIVLMRVIPPLYFYFEAFYLAFFFFAMIDVQKFTFADNFPFLFRR